MLDLGVDCKEKWHSMSNQILVQNQKENQRKFIISGMFNELNYETEQTKNEFQLREFIILTTDL